MSDFISNNKYLTDNGFSVGNSGLIKAITDFISSQIGIGATSGTGSGYESSLEAYAAAHEGPNYYAGIGIRGERTKNITTSPDILEDPNTTYSFLSTVGSPANPNFWGVSDYFSKSEFLNKLSNIISTTENYLLILENITESVTNIISGNNSKFPSFMQSIYNDSPDVDMLITDINDCLISIESLNAFFTGATGSEGNFNSNIDSLETTLSNYKTSIENRISSNYLEKAMVELRKWREFWIKERIFKYSGSLVSLRGLNDALTLAKDERDVKEDTLEVIFSNTNEWIKPPTIYATYYNPIVEEVLVSEDQYEYIETKRISFIYSTQEHAEFFNVYRKTLDEVNAIGFDSGDWPNDSLLTEKGYGEEYNDKENISSTNQIYVYRIQTVDNVNETYSKSLQSNLLGEEVSIIDVPTNNKILLEDSVEGFIYIDGQVNYITNVVEIEEGFEATLETPITNTSITSFNKMTCIARNYFLE